MEEKIKIYDVFKNGSAWLRADFHLHTIKDKEFEPLQNPNDFFNQFISRLKDEQINIGVITNHNKFCKEEYSNLKKKAISEQIWILPGVELSVNDGTNGIHCLIIFDNKNWLKNSEDYINQFLTAAFEGIANRENENTRCNYNFKDVLTKLDEHKKQGRDSFIILAHVDQNRGFFNELKGGRIQQLANTELFRAFVLGFQKMRTYDKIETYKDWFGGKLPAFVEGSDCKCISDVGKAQIQNEVEKKTYVKIGDFNFEALKYALTDVENRVSNLVKPDVNNAYIKSIQFDGGKLDKVHIDFSPELNNLIGIRGSGKSSILEIIRYSLGIPLSKTAIDSKYKNDLIQYILGSGGKSILTLVNKQKAEYRIEKIYGQKEDIFKGDILQPGISLDAIFDYPVYFGQKDLSNKDVDFESDLIHRLIGTKVKTTQDMINAKKREVENLIVEINKLRNLKSVKEEVEILINNSLHQLSIYKEKGIDEKLKQQTKFDEDISKVEQIKNSADNYLKELCSVINNYEYLFSQKISGSELNREIFDEISELYSSLKSEFEKLNRVHSNSALLGKKINDVFVKISEKKEGLKEEFAKIKREIDDDSINPDEFLKLNRQIEMSKLTLIEIDKSEVKRIDLKNLLLEKLVELNNLWLEKFRILEAEVDKINKSGNKLSINITFKGRKDKFLEKITQMCKGTGITKTAYQKISDGYNDFIEIHKDHSLLKVILNENQIADFNKRFSENMIELLTFEVENKIVISYNSKLLENHSLGQRASALILFLLAQKDNDILIIDQPEDDLDNQTIYDEVIKEIKKLKGNMQFIFATHNANIPVLGDSEKVIACFFDEMGINVHSGNVDDYQTQKSIVDIMEGGNEAFNRRKNIYGIWNTEKGK